jgi:hypothetical protein
MQQLLDAIERWGKGATLVYIGAVVGGIYLIIELIVGVGDVPGDYTLTPTAYFAFLTGGGGIVSLANAALKGARVKAGVPEQAPPRVPSPADQLPGDGDGSVVVDFDDADAVYRGAVVPPGHRPEQHEVRDLHDGESGT